MNPINLAPMQELFTNTSDPHHIAQMLDELAFDYARTTIELERYANGTHTGVCKQATSHLWLLQLLRDTIKACQ